MRKLLLLALRASAMLLAFLAQAGLTLFGGILLSGFATSTFSERGIGSADPRGRGSPIIDYEVGFLIPALFGLAAAWLIYLATYRKNWSFDLFVAAPIFLVSGPVTAANWLSFDVIYTRDAQALLNIFLIASAIAVAFILQKSLSSVSSMFAKSLGQFLLLAYIYMFAAIPLWYTISYLSWKLGAGKLDTLDDAAKTLGAAGSLLAALGFAWKEGAISFKKKEA